MMWGLIFEGQNNMLIRSIYARTLEFKSPRYKGEINTY
jgi:hypothetical protein